MIFVYNLARMRSYIIIVVDLVPVPQSLDHVGFCNVFGMILSYQTAANSNFKWSLQYVITIIDYKI